MPGVLITITCQGLGSACTWTRATPRNMGQGSITRTQRPNLLQPWQHSWQLRVVTEAGQDLLLLVGAGPKQWQLPPHMLQYTSVLGLTQYSEATHLVSLASSSPQLAYFISLHLITSDRRGVDTQKLSYTLGQLFAGHVYTRLLPAKENSFSGTYYMCHWSSSLLLATRWGMLGLLHFPKLFSTKAYIQ